MLVGKEVVVCGSDTILTALLWSPCVPLRKWFVQLGAGGLSVFSRILGRIAACWKRNDPLFPSSIARCIFATRKSTLRLDGPLVMLANGASPAEQGTWLCKVSSSP